MGASLNSRHARFNVILMTIYHFQTITVLVFLCLFSLFSALVFVLFQKNKSQWFLVPLLSVFIKVMDKE